MTLVAPKPGGWSVGEVLTSAQMEALQDELVKAIDGTGGGTYALIAALILTGQALRASNVEIPSGGFLHILSGGDIDVNSGATVSLEAGSNTNLAGDINVLSGGDINLAAGGDINLAAASQINLATGAQILALTGAQLLAVDPDGMAYNAFTLAWRHSLTPHSVSFSAGAPDWVSNVSTNWIQHQVSGGQLIIFPLNLKPGDTLTSVIIRINGAVFAGHAGSLPAVKPVYTLISVNSGGSTTIDSSSDSAGSAAAYDVPHNTTLSGGSLPLIVSNSDKYYLLVTGESGANAVADTTGILAISGNGLGRVVRGNNELI